MKQIYLFVALIALSLTASAGRPVNSVVTASGNWSDKYSWSLTRVPQDGDSVVVPIGSEIVIDQDNSLNNLYINVLGTLTLKKALTLNDQSVVTLESAGALKARNASRGNEVLIIGGVKKFDQNAPVKIVGYKMANKNTGVSPNGFSITATLPVTYSSFYVTKNNENIIINWSTAQELNNNNFEIQRSYNGSNWTVIGIVLGTGTTTNASMYQYTDKNMTAAVTYYRIRQVDQNGSYSYSTVKSVRNGATAQVAKIYAAGKNINIEFNTEVKNAITVKVFNTNGQVIAQQQYQNAATRISLNANTAGAGLYVVQVTGGMNVLEATKIIL